MSMKKIILLLVCSTILMARPPHEETIIARPLSPLAPELELYLPVTTLILERRKTVHSEDLTLVAIIEVLKNAQTLASTMAENPTRIVEDFDIRRAIKYLDAVNLKTKIF